MKLNALVRDYAGEAPAEAPQPEAAPQPEEPALDPALVEAGARVFRRCQACHQVGDTARNTVGPHLNGIVGRTAGTVEDFRYSPALTEAGAGGLTWDAQSLAAYLENPRGYLPGNRMAFPGLPGEEDRDALIAYLTSMSR